MEENSGLLFNKAFQEIIGAFEGGYSNDKDDPGGETYKGIARTKNPGFAGWKLIDGLKNEGNFPGILEKSGLLQVMVRNFYKTNYWDIFWGDKLEEESSEEMFDQTVNLGPARAIEHLQRSLNILNKTQTLYPDVKVDGIFGNRTLEAYKNCCQKVGEKILVNIMNMYQGKYYIELMEKQSIFEKFAGLFKRISIQQ